MRPTPLWPFSLLVALTSSAASAQQRNDASAREHWPADAFADSGASNLVLHALALRDSAAAGLASYEATATERMHVGLQVTRRLPLRSRTLYHREQVARVYWQGNGEHRVRWLGRREGTPAVGDDWADHAPFDIDFDVVDELDLDNIRVDVLFDPIGDRMDLFQAGFIQPISAPGLRTYRYASGDTMQIRLPDRSITLVEVVVRPRMADWEAVEGSLWFDSDTGVLVRAAFRPSGVWDMAVFEARDYQDVPGFLRPAIGTITAIAIEYGLYERRWWLPRRVRAEGIFDWGSGLVRMPLTIEWTMTGHTVNEAPGPAVTPGPDLVHAGTRRAASGRTTFLVERGVDLERAAVLPPPIADVELIAFTREELGPLVRRIEQVAGPPPRGPAPPLPYALLQSFRYDRVRGASAGLGWSGDAGRFTFEIQGRLATAIPEPFGHIGVTRGSWNATLYHRLANASDWNADGLGNTMATLLFGHDGGDYYRSSGLSLGRENHSERAGARVEAFVENQRAIARQTNVSLATLGGGSLRPNLEADEITVGGVRALFTGRLGSDVRRTVLNGRVWTEAATGDADYARIAASARLTATPRNRTALAAEVAAGVAGNGAPIQRSFFLGGPGTLRGVEENTVTGPAFWLTRGEAGIGLPGARVMLFLDLGWAGERDHFTRSRPAAGAGAGASFMDGTFRVDLARGVLRSNAWRAYFYVDALL